MLETLHREAGYIRNFGIAVGYRLTFVYPAEGNKKAIGLYYPDLPEQWPAIEQAIAARQPVLIGPIDLVRGDKGLAYRIPVFINDRYRGLISTVIDSGRAVRKNIRQPPTRRPPVRGFQPQRRPRGSHMGDVALFGQPEAVSEEISVPGGRWIITAKSAVKNDAVSSSLLFRLMIGILSLTISFLLYQIDAESGRLSDLALYDPLTKLPNRILLFEGRPVNVGASVGAAFFPESGGSLKDVFKAADRLMYTEKARRKTGRNI